MAKKVVKKVVRQDTLTEEQKQAVKEAIANAIFRCTTICEDDDEAIIYLPKDLYDTPLLPSHEERLMHTVSYNRKRETVSLRDGLYGHAHHERHTAEVMALSIQNFRLSTIVENFLSYLLETWALY